MTVSDLNGPTLAERISAAQLDKLTLEVAQLHDDVRGSRVAKRIAAMTPLLTVIIGVSGFLFGIYQFQSQQRDFQTRALAEQRRADETDKREQQLRIQAQIRTDAEALLRFFIEGDQTISSAAFRLEAMKSSLVFADAAKSSDSRSHYLNENVLTACIVKSVVDDSDLARWRDVAFVRLLLTSWPMYRDYLKTHQASTEYITDQYVDAAKTLASRAPQALAGIRDDAANNAYMYTGGKVGLNEHDVSYFDDLVFGLKEHLKLIANDNERNRQIDRFGSVINNKKLARGLLTFRP